MKKKPVINEWQSYRPTQRRGWVDQSLGLVCHPSQEVQLLRLHCLDHRSLNLVYDRWPGRSMMFSLAKDNSEWDNERVWLVYALKSVNTHLSNPPSHFSAWREYRQPTCNRWPGWKCDIIPSAIKAECFAHNKWEPTIWQRLSSCWISSLIIEYDIIYLEYSH